MGREFSLERRGATIRYRRFGQGPALLFLRSEDSLADPPGFTDALADDFDVIVPDHPGFRSSDTPDWLKGIGDAAYFYLDFLDRLGLHSVHMVGGSLGGWMAAEIAVRSCERIATINLIAPFGVRRKGMPFGDIFMWTPEENLRHRLFDQALAEQLLTAAKTQSPEAATADLKDRYATARLAWHPRFHNPELERWLPRIVRPLQLIWGDADLVVPIGIADAWRQALPPGAAERDRTMRPLAPARAPAGHGGKNPVLHRRGGHVKFFAFHLMPYRHLDFDAADAHRSYWVVLPNSHYDPKKGARLYQEYIDQLVFAAKVGFDGICVNEHHQTAYGLMPAPNIIASALIDRTRGMDVKIAVIGRALPIVSNPLTIAEEFAMLDNLSDGRLIAGFVRGIGCEYHSTEVNPVYSHERFHEAHDLIVRAWTETGPFRFEGDHYNFGYVNTWPRCVQAPHPPIWIPSQGSGETIEWAAAPERKYPVIMAFAPTPAVVRFHRAYRQQAEKFGYEISGDQLGWSTPTYVAETDEIAAREAAEHLEALFNNFFHIPPELMFPPGYTSIRSLQAMLEARKGLAAVRVTFNDLMTRGNVIVGSPATVREKIEAIHAETGFRIMVPMTQFGTLPDELVKKSTQMFAEEVAPKLRAL